MPAALCRSCAARTHRPGRSSPGARLGARPRWSCSDRKSTRLNSSHRTISYAVFCLKKKKQKIGIVDIEINMNKQIKLQEQRSHDEHYLEHFVARVGSSYAT